MKHFHVTLAGLAALSLAAPAMAAQIIDLRADAGVTKNGANQVTGWADQSGAGNNAAPPTAGPLATTAVVNGVTRPVLRFDGTNQFLTAAPHVPAVGTLLVVYSNADPTNPFANRRLVGWEDSAAGNHGIGLMPNFGAGVYVVARKAGTGGDVSVAPKAGTAMEVDAISWGPAGVTLTRQLADGSTLNATTNTTITSVSDGGFGLHIGAPGDGGASGNTGFSQPFAGDLAALQVYDTQLSASARAAAIDGLYNTYVAVPEPASGALAAVASLGLLARRRRRRAVGG